MTLRHTLCYCLVSVLFLAVAAHLSHADCDGGPYYTQDIGFIQFCNRSTTIGGSDLTLHNITMIYTEDGTDFFSSGSQYDADFSYYGSPFYFDQGGAAQVGLPQLYYAEHDTQTIQEFSKVFTLPSSNGNPTHSLPNGFKFYKQIYPLDIEGYCAMINQTTALCKIAVNNSHTSNRANATFSTEVGSNIDAASLRSATLDTSYDGVVITVREELTSFSSSEMNHTWLMAVNVTPDHLNVSQAEESVEWVYDLAPEEYLEVAFVMVDNASESKISDYVSDVSGHLTHSRSEVNTWLQKFHYPSYCSNSTLCWMYYRNIAGVWQNWQCPITVGGWSNTTSNFGTTCFWSPSKQKYHGIWASDTSRLCEDLLDGTNDSQVIQNCKNQIDLFVQYENTDHFRDDIRDSYMGTGVQSPIIQCTALQLYRADGNNASWLSTVYGAMKNDTIWRYTNRRDSNGLYYCGGLECGDGRGSDVVAPDYNAEMYWLYKCMAVMGNATGNHTDTINYWSGNQSFLDGKLHHFIKNCDGYGDIYSDLAKDSLACKTERNDSTGLSFKLLWTNHSEINSSAVTMMADALRNASRYNQSAGGINDVSQVDYAYNEGGGLWWHGNRWSILSQFASYGFDYYGEDYLAGLMRNQTLQMCSEVSTGTEWFVPNNSNHDGNGNIQWYSWTMGNCIGLMNTGEYSINFNSPVGSIATDIGYLNDTCVATRTCCEAVSNSLDFACFRNDTNASFSNPFEPKDLYDSSKPDNMFLSYDGGAMKVEAADIYDYRVGLGRTKYRGYNAIAKHMMTVASDYDTLHWNGWGYTWNGDVSGTLSARSEGYVVPVDRHAWLMLWEASCLDGDNCDGVTPPSQDAYYIKHQGANDTTSTVTYRNDIDGSYSGFEILITSSAGSFATVGLNDSFLIVTNVTPTGHNESFDDDDARLYYSINNGEGITIAAVIIPSEFEADVSDYLSDPYGKINDAIAYQTMKARELRYPSSLNNTHKKRYYFGLNNYFYNTQCSLPKDVATSNYGDRCVYVPSYGGYRGTWIWDSGLSCWGLLEACNPGSTSCYDTCKSNLEFWVNFSKTDGQDRWIRQVHENKTGTASQWQPNGIWSTNAWHLYDRNVITFDYLCDEVFPSLTTNYWDIVNDRSIGNSQLTASAGDMGWDGSKRFSSNGAQLDVTGWTAIDANSLAKIASTCGDYDNASTFLANLTNWRSGLEAMYNDTWKNYVDRNSAGGVHNATSPAISPASCWAVVANASTQAHAFAVFNSFYNSSQLNTSYILPTLQTQHSEFDPNGTVHTWNGRSWAPPNMMCLQAAITYDNQTVTDYLAPRFLDLIDIDPAGYESYASDTGLLPQNNFRNRPYLWSESLYYMSVWKEPLFDLITLSGPTPPTNWTELFLYVNNATNDGFGVLRRTDVTSGLYEEEPYFIEAYMNMYETTGDERFLNWSYVHIKNITDRYPTWGFTTCEMRYGHVGGLLARFAYLVNKTDADSWRDEAAALMGTPLSVISGNITSCYTSWTSGGITYGGLKNTTEASPYRIKPINQHYGYAIMQMYLYNVTGNETYLDRAAALSRAINLSFAYDACHYDAGLLCHSNPYRYNYSQSGEEYASTIEYGHAGHDESLNYFSQDLEMFYRFWKHGFFNNNTMEYIENLIMYDMYLREGGLTNVLVSDQTKHPSTTFSDFNKLYMTHRSHHFAYLTPWNVTIANITLAVLQHTYDFAHDGDYTYSFYDEPYYSITDPRTGQGSVYAVADYSNLTADVLLNQISTYLYDSSGREVFYVPTAAPSSPGSTTTYGDAEDEGIQSTKSLVIAGLIILSLLAIATAVFVILGASSGTISTAELIAVVIGILLLAVVVTVGIYMISLISSAIGGIG